MGLLSAMYEDDADFTNTFRALGSVTSQPADSDEDGVPAPLIKVCSIACLSCVSLDICEGAQSELACAWCKPAANLS